MELSKIEQLLVKYENAETTLQEETTLKNYFSKGNVAPHLQEYESMFGYFAFNKAETSAKPIQLNTKKKNWKWLSVAASVVLMISVYTGNNYVQEQKAKAQYAEVMNTLKMLSTNLNKGNEAMSSLYVYEDTVNKIFKSKNLSESQKIHFISSFDKAKTTKEAKLVYESLIVNLQPKKQAIKESIGFASKATGIAPKKQIIESSDIVTRMQRLAGLK